MNEQVLVLVSVAAGVVSIGSATISSLRERRRRAASGAQDVVITLADGSSRRVKVSTSDLEKFLRLCKERE